MSLYNKIKYELLLIKKEKFDIDNIKCDITNKNIRKTFLNIDYNISNKLILDGLYLETGKVDLLSEIKLIPKFKNKYIIELPLLNNSLLSTILKKIDIKFNSLINNIKTHQSNFTNLCEKNIENLNYSCNIKQNYINFNDNLYFYDYIKLKLNTNECLIYYNNKPFYNKLELLNYNNISINCIIQSYGIWNYNDIYGFTWKIVKMYIKDNDYNNIDTNIINNKIDINDDDYIVKKNKSKTEYNIQIPNFELETEHL